MIYLFGAGGHAKVIIEILEQQNLEVAGLIDTNPDITNLLNYTVYHNFNDIQYNAQNLIIISIGNNSIRKSIANKLDVKFTKAIHTSVNVSKRCTIGQGTVVMAGVSINCNAAIGKHVILNTGSIIDHDCVIGDYAHISPNVGLAGNVSVGEGAHIGIGACVIQGVKIGKWATVGAGSVIIKDVPDYAVVVGNPGKIIKFNLSNN